jgi:hypothetical protein
MTYMQHGGELLKELAWTTPRRQPPRLQLLNCLRRRAKFFTSKAMTKEYGGIFGGGVVVTSENNLFDN